MPGFCPGKFGGRRVCPGTIPWYAEGLCFMIGKNGLMQGQGAGNPGPAETPFVVNLPKSGCRGVLCTPAGHRSSPLHSRITTHPVEAPQRGTFVGSGEARERFGWWPGRPTERERTLPRRCRGVLRTSAERPQVVLYILVFFGSILECSPVRAATARPYSFGCAG